MRVFLDTVGDIYPEFAFLAHEALGDGGLTKSDVRARYMVARVRFSRNTTTPLLAYRSDYNSSTTTGTTRS